MYSLPLESDDVSLEAIASSLAHLGNPSSELSGKSIEESSLGRYVFAVLSKHPSRKKLINTDDSELDARTSSTMLVVQKGVWAPSSSKLNMVLFDVEALGLVSLDRMAPWTFGVTA